MGVTTVVSWNVALEGCEIVWGDDMETAGAIAYDCLNAGTRVRNPIQWDGHDNGTDDGFHRTAISAFFVDHWLAGSGGDG